MKKAKLLISLVTLFILVSCNTLHYGAGALSGWTTGLIPWVIGKPLQKMFLDGTDDLMKNLQSPSKNKNQRHYSEKSLNNADNLDPQLFEQLNDLKTAQEQKKCLGCVPWEKVYSCEQMERIEGHFL